MVVLPKRLLSAAAMAERKFARAAQSFNWSNTIDYDSMTMLLGEWRRASVVRAKIEDWDQTFRVNLRAPMILAKELLPAMIEKGEGGGHQYRLGVRQKQ